MENTIDWSTWIIAGSAFITAIATGVLVYITWRYVRLTREMLEISYRPEVVVRLLRTGETYLHDKVKNPLLTVHLKNVGPGVARNVKFEKYLSFNPIPDEIDEPLLKRVYFFNSVIDRLVPGEELRSIDLPGFPPSDPNKFQVTITGTWEDLKGKKYCEDFHLNFADPNLPQR